jgi:RNA polymerase sigma-70 factor (ECF subfamily)
MAFWKTTVDGESAADAAADLNMTRNAVYLAKSRVLRRLREEFTDPFDAEVTDPKEP